MAATTITTTPHFLLLLLSLLPSHLLLALTQDGVLLLSFKTSLLADPLASLAGWRYGDDIPCAWNGVVCVDSRVVGLFLPDAQLVGPIAGELGLLERLRHLDLSGNALNGTLPGELFGAAELRVLSLAGNGIAGELPELVGRLRSLRALNLASNALSGGVPASLALLPNLTAVSLADNYLSGELPSGGFPSLQVLDVSSNQLNGSLPPDFGGKALRYVNLSSNRLAGAIPPEMASNLPTNVTIDLSYNNLTGEIPASEPFVAQRPAAFAGNPDLCGRPLRNLCAIPSTLSSPPNGTRVRPAGAESPPALAAMPKNPAEGLPGGNSSGGGGGASVSARQGGLRLATIVAIAAGDLAGIAILLVVFLYLYQVKRRRQRQEVQKESRSLVVKRAAPSESPDTGRALACCLPKKARGDAEEASETSISGGTEEDMNSKKLAGAAALQGKQPDADGAMLVTVDGDTKLELETLLKASAYILSAAGSSIVYKAVLADGTALAVRRIGIESGGIQRFKDFDVQVRAIAKVRHANLLRLRGFYWGPEERLLIHDFAINGSLANVSIKRRPGASPVHLGWDERVRIANGVARGLAYLHEKRCVHGNVKPSNIMLDSDMEPLLADFGLDRLVPGMDRRKSGMSARQFASKRSAKSLPDLSSPPGASPFAPSSSSQSGGAQYQSPESLKNNKPNAKWDVYSFGMVLLELVTGRVFTDVEVCQWSTRFKPEERSKIFQLADPALHGELESKEEAAVSCLMLGFSCCAMAPQKRPPMKDVLLVLERIRSSSVSIQ